MIKHVTIDVWGTIIKSNPEYGKNKALYLKKKFSLPHSPEEILRLWRRVDGYFSERDVKTGKYGLLEDRLLSILSILGISPMTAGDLGELHQDLCALFLQSMPTLYSEDTYNVLADINNRAGVESMTIVSNTGTIQGKQLRLVLQHLNIDRMFDSQMYSDEQGVSKPSTEMFQRVATTYASANYDGSEFLHIGDDLIADGVGARRAGFKHFIINTNEYSILDALNLLEPF